MDATLSKKGTYDIHPFSICARMGSNLTQVQSPPQATPISVALSSDSRNKELKFTAPVSAPRKRTGREPVLCRTRPRARWSSMCSCSKSRQARLRSSTFFRCRHSHSTGFRSGAYGGNGSKWILPPASATNSLTSARRWIGDPSQITHSRSPTRRPRGTRNSMPCNPFSDFGRTSESTLPCGGHAAHDRQVVVRLPLVQDRRLSLRGIGLDHPRQQVEPRLVHENKLPALAAGLLLQCGPRLDPPALDRLFIPLDRSGDGDLRGPSQSLEQARHLALAVRDPELLGEDPGDPLTGPDLSPEAVRLRAMPEEVGDQVHCTLLSAHLAANFREFQNHLLRAGSTSVGPCFSPGFLAVFCPNAGDRS